MARLVYILIAIFLCQVGIAPVALSATYLIGTDPADDYATYAIFRAAHTEAAGDIISFRKGETFAASSVSGLVVAPTSGTADNIITYTSHGSGANPVFYGGITIASGSWTNGDAASGVWSYAYGSSYPYMIWEDSIPLIYATSANCTDGNWFMDDTKLYYKPTLGTLTDHVIERATYYGIDTNSKDYIAISGIDFTKFYKCVRGYNSSHISISLTNCSNSIYGTNCQANATFESDITITTNTYSNIQESIFVGGVNCEAVPCGTDGVMIAFNKIIDGGIPYGTTAYSLRSVTSGDTEGIGVQNVTHSTITRNSINGVCRGIIDYVCTSGTSYNVFITRNYINTTHVGLVSAPYDLASSFYNHIVAFNVFNSCGAADVSNYRAAILLGNSGTPTTAWNYAYGNVMVGNANSIFVKNPTGKTSVWWDVYNNISDNQSGYHVKEFQASTNFNCDYNSYYPDKAGGFYNGGNLAWEQWKALNGTRDANSPSPAYPLFSPGSYFTQYTSPCRGAGLNGTDIGLGTQPSLTGSMTGVCQ